MALRVRLAGRVGIEIESSGAGVDEGGLGRPARLAFAYLVSERHRPVPRDELADVVWGENLPRSWEQLLRGIASKLRTWLGSAGLDPSKVVTTALGVYQLHLPPDATIDVEEAAVAALAAEAAIAGNDMDRAFEAGSESVGVASRQFLPGGSGAWVERRQVELREVHVRGLEAVSEAEAARGHWSAAVAAAEEAIRLEPFRESGYLRLMAAHAGAGNRGEALRAYERCRRTMAEELGVGTSVPTEAAYLALLGDEPTARPLPAAGAPLPLPGALAIAADAFLVGREAQVERMAAAFERASHGGRHAMLVAGEPGIGKTALVAEFARRAHAQGARVLYGRCDEELGVPYQPFAQALGHYVAHCPLPELTDHVDAYGGELLRLVPQLGRRLPDTAQTPSIDPEAGRFRLFEAVAGLLAAASRVRTVVLVLDDLHWAANASLLLLRHVLQAADSLDLLVVGTYRHSEVSTSHPLAATLADLRRERADIDRMVLGGLDADAVAAYVERTAGHALDADEQALALAVYAHTAGNPFFLGQLLRHLSESGAVYRREGPWSYYRDAAGMGVPEGVREVVGRRLERLSEATNRAMVLASVIGADFDLEVLEAVGEPGDSAGCLDAMDEALAGYLLVELGEGHYRFSHALVQETIYSGLTATRRGRLHRLVGEALESIAGGCDSARLPSLAHHFAVAASAGCARKAADYALAASRQAIGQAAWEDAIALLERGLVALAAHEPPDFGRRCDLLLLLAETWIRFFDPPRALAAAASAVDAARELGVPERLGQAAYWYLRSIGDRRHGDHAASSLMAKAFAEEALTALGEDMPALQAKILSMLGARGMFGEIVGSTFDTALALARSSSDPEALGVALSMSCNALRGSPRAREFLALAEELVTSAPSDGWDGWRNGHGLRAMGRLSVGDRLGFEVDVSACERLGSERRFWYFRWNAATWRATLALLDGRFAEVEALSATARDIAPTGLGGREFFLRQVFKLRHEQGDLAGAHSAACQLMDDWPHNTIHIAMQAFSESELLGVDRDRGRFEAFVDESLGPMPPERWPVTLAYRSEVAVALGDAERAARLYDSFTPYQGQVVIGGMGDGCMGAVDRYLGMLAANMGDWEAAEGHYDIAVGCEEGLGSEPLAARSRYWYGQMLTDRGRPGDSERARRLVEASALTAGRLGMAALAGRAGALLGRM